MHHTVIIIATLSSLAAVKIKRTIKEGKITDSKCAACKNKQGMHSRQKWEQLEWTGLQPSALMTLIGKCNWIAGDGGQRFVLARETLFFQVQLNFYLLHFTNTIVMCTVHSRLSDFFELGKTQFGAKDVEILLKIFMYFPLQETIKHRASAWAVYH